MSREVRRVPLDFDWPLNERWHGYLMPDKFDETPCMDCFRRGATPAMQWIERVGQMLAQLVEDIDDQTAGKDMHPWLTEDAYPPTYTEYDKDSRRVTRHEVVRPSADILVFAQRLVADDRYEHARVLRRGFDAFDNRDAIARGLIRAAGLPEKWGWCKSCAGHGSTEAYEGQRAEAEAWEPTEPPTGEGWQLWETVSEGSPITQVYPDREGLIEFLCSEEYRWGASRPLTRSQAESFVSAGSSIGSAVVIDGHLVAGDAAVELMGGAS